MEELISKLRPAAQLSLDGKKVPGRGNHQEKFWRWKQAEHVGDMRPVGLAWKNWG